jgi:hypothetical protein
LQTTEALCHLSVTDIKKKHFSAFDFFVKMKLVLTVWVKTSLSKFGYYQPVTLLLQYSLTSLDLSFDKWIAVDYGTQRTYLMPKNDFFSGRCVLRKKIGGKVAGRRKTSSVQTIYLPSFTLFYTSDGQTDRQTDTATFPSFSF